MQLNTNIDNVHAMRGPSGKRASARTHRGTPLNEVKEDCSSSSRGQRNTWNEELELILTRLSPFDVPVLIQGETGTGKEVVARTLHEHSERRLKAFLKLNCAALPAELIESELFGYERGAFTGANKSTPGKFELANGGTIFLDEIGDMNVDLQAKLLQVLQDQEFLPLGSREPIRVDVRVIAATHRDLERAVECGQFREDLYYRLEVFSIKVPPLRERRESILELAKMFLESHAHAEMQIPSMTPELETLLLEYSWPGNVRELENMMRKLLIYRDSIVIGEELLRRIGKVNRPTCSAVNLRSQSETQTKSPTLEMFRKSRDEEEAQMILSTLHAARWNRKQAAQRLQMDYKAFLYRMKRLGIEGATEEAS